MKTPQAGTHHLGQSAVDFPNRFVNLSPEGDDWICGLTHSAEIESRRHLPEILGPALGFVVCRRLQVLICSEHHFFRLFWHTHQSKGFWPTMDWLPFRIPTTGVAKSSNKNRPDARDLLQSTCVVSTHRQMTFLWTLFTGGICGREV